MAGPGSGNCSSHEEMYGKVVENHTMMKAMRKNIKDLYNKNENVIKTINDNNTAVMEKLNGLELHFVQKEAARDRRTIDKYKKAAGTILKVIFYVLAACLGGTGIFAIIQTIILKIWR